MWNRSEYQDMTSVAYRDGCLHIGFADGTTVSVQAGRVLPPHVAAPDWSQVATDGFEIVAPSADGEVAVPWDVIRVLTDKRFATHRAAQAEDQARKIGERIRALRLQRGLTGKELAERAGIAPQSLSRIEHGKHDVVLTTLRRILAAMGASWSDLVSDEDSEVERHGATRTG